MIYSREQHYLFLEEELRAQTDAFNQKLETSAHFLLTEREEMFVAKFLKFEDGEMILKFSNKRGLPRKGEYLYCFTTPKEYHNFRTWGDTSYGTLLKAKGYGTEVVCIWQASLQNDSDYCIAGFRGIDVDFANHIEAHPGAFLILGPNVPPYEYIHNLQKIVRTRNEEAVRNILDNDYDGNFTESIPIVSDRNISNLIIQQLSFTDSVILQGPPGTGKTHQIARICKTLCDEGKSVLVTALTNRALMEVAEKEDLKDLLASGRICKTKISVDEAKELPQLSLVKRISAISGNIVLSTFYITSGEASELNGEPPFDVVIMDEASQALLSMIAAIHILGKKCIFVGDTKQLPPVVCLNEDRIRRRNYNTFLDGMSSLSSLGNIPSYILTESFRLPKRAVEYTGLFYGNVLQSQIPESQEFTFPSLGDNSSYFFNRHGGPSLIKTNLPIGNKKPINALLIATKLVEVLLITGKDGNKTPKIAVLSFYIETTKSLQKAIYQTLGSHKNLLIDTVSRIQGLTTDVVIYVVPNTGYSRSLEKRLFNVATSRARQHTIIISDNSILSNTMGIDSTVYSFIKKLEAEQSLYIPLETNGTNEAQVSRIVSEKIALTSTE